MSKAIEDLAVSKASAGIAIGGTIMGLTISEWAALLTAIFVLMQIIVLLPKFTAQVRSYYRKFKNWLSKQG